MSITNLVLDLSISITVGRVIQDTLYPSIFNHILISWNSCESILNLKFIFFFVNFTNSSGKQLKSVGKNMWKWVLLYSFILLTIRDLIVHFICPQFSNWWIHCTCAIYQGQKFWYDGTIVHHTKGSTLNSIHKISQPLALPLMIL